MRKRSRGETSAATGAQQRINRRVSAVNDLSRQVKNIEKKRTAEKDTKAQKSVHYMETYAARKARYARTRSRLEKRLEEDKAGILSLTPHLAAAHEKNMKHDANIKKAMKAALHSMQTVHDLARNKDPADPTVQAAETSVNDAQGSDVYTVLGLDSKQLGKEYLLSLDAAVAAYDAKPTASSQEKLQKAVKATRESMKKDEIKEANKKNEKHAKKQRGEKNKKYYKVKWEEKKTELAAKKRKKNKMAKNLQEELNRKQKLRVQDADEKSTKEFKNGNEKKQKIGKDNKEAKAKADKKQAAANKKINQEQKAKAEQKKLQDAAKKANADYIAKKEVGKQANQAKDTADKEVVSATSGSVFAIKQVSVFKKKLAAAKALAASVASAANIRMKADAQAALTSKETAALKAKQVVTQAKATLKEKEAKLAKAEIAKDASKTEHQAAEKKAALFADKLQASKPVTKPVNPKKNTESQMH